jgi:hypothetical protein
VRQRYRMVESQRWRGKRGLKFHLQAANWPFNARLVDGVVIAVVEAGRDPDRSLRRARWPPTCSARQSTCRTAKCSGDRTASNRWGMR